MKKENQQSRQILMFIVQADGFTIDWQEGSDDLNPQQIQTQQALYTAFRSQPEQALYDLAFMDSSSFHSPSSRYFGVLSLQFVQQLAQRPEREFLREAIDIDLTSEHATDLVSQAPFMNGLEHLNMKWINQIWQRLQAIYAAEIQSYTGTVTEYLAARHATVQTAGRICFHLVENKRDDLPFAFLATYVAGVDPSGKARHLPLKNALLEYKSDQSKLLTLLSTVHRAADKSPFIHEMIDSGEIFQPIGLTSQEAYTFLREIPVYEESGILCRMPDWWKKRSGSARVTVSIGTREPSRIGFDALVDFQINLNLGDLQLSADDLRQLLTEAEGLVLIKGRWVEVDHAKLQAVLQAYERTRKKLDASGMSLADAIRLQLHTAKDLTGDESAAAIEISHGAWLQSLLQQLASADVSTLATTGEQFLAHLRPYQEKGLAWLHQMKALRLGACLADDMGLGKTVQVIALLNAIRSQQRERSLLVVPASLIGNWKQEITRFAPSLRVAVLHPSELSPGQGNEADLPDRYDLLITTYGMLDRYDWLKSSHWDTLILDEAQAIKNPATRQTRAAKQISASWRVALTGTPIENRLSDLWSLFDFLNKGLLGSAKEFTHFSQHLQDHQSDYTRLKQVLSPFILRRLKTDRMVISDLPDKIEMKTYTSLSKKQLVLYRHLVDELKDKLNIAVEGIERKGLILSSILKFKQICNHPDQFLGQTQYQEAESGKYARLREICETIYEKRERVLVFTQFKEMTGPLQKFLEEIFAHQGLVLHGGTPVAKRKQIVETFQGDAYVPFLVLSIKAGGVGLNLTAANHVIHFDRWWNPAVENQATDRAFRIGQQKNVIVHKFVTTGTIEEKIDRLIEEKTSLAREIMPEKQETWITEMNNQQLLDLFSLSV